MNSFESPDYTQHHGVSAPAVVGLLAMVEEHTGGADVKSESRTDWLALGL